MSDAVDDLILDLLEWIGPGARPYGEVLEAWRTSCPRLPVWEDAKDRGLVASRYEPGRGRIVSVSAAGRTHLREHRAPDGPDGAAKDRCTSSPAASDDGGIPGGRTAGS
jgi:hypothetical protein